MTIPYNSSEYGSLLKFIQALREDGIEYRSLDEKEKVKIKDIHKDFFNKIKGDLKRDLFERENAEKTITFQYNK